MSDSKFLAFSGLIAIGLGTLGLLLNSKKKGRELPEWEVRELLKKEGLYNFEDNYLDNYLQSFSEPGEQQRDDGTYFRHSTIKTILEDEKKRRKIAHWDDERLQNEINTTKQHLNKLRDADGTIDQNSYVVRIFTKTLSILRTEKCLRLDKEVKEMGFDVD